MKYTCHAHGLHMERTLGLSRPLKPAAVPCIRRKLPDSAKVRFSGGWVLSGGYVWVK